MTYIMGEYDEALQTILKKGIRTSNRTGTDCLTVFGMQTRYRIDECFPILTKRKVFPKAIFAELLWMLSGSTNINDLEKLGSKIWTAWRDPAFEQRNGYDDGELGPIYGWSFRHYGGDYDKRKIARSPASTQYRQLNPYALLAEDCATEEVGFDQVQYIIDELKSNKSSRRLIINLWDPKIMTSDKVKLPCCHYAFNLFVDNNDNLSGMLTQRSADYPVGVGSGNICFYAALIYMFAQQCGLKPYELIHSTANSHIYVDQVEATEEYLSRPEIDSPKLILNKANDINSYSLADFIIQDYNPAKIIKFPVTV